MAPAGNTHGRVAMNVSAPTDQHVGANGLGVAFAAETGFEIFGDPGPVRASDTALVRRGRVEVVDGSEGFWPGASGLAVAVVFPNDRFAGVEEKVTGWLASGTGMVVVVNPEGTAPGRMLPVVDVFG